MPTDIKFRLLGATIMFVHETIEIMKLRFSTCHPSGLTHSYKPLYVASPNSHYSAISILYYTYMADTNYHMWENFGGGKFGEWIVICQIFTLQIFYLTNTVWQIANFLPSKLPFTLQTITPPRRIKMEQVAQNVSNYCGFRLLYSNGRRIVRISYLPFTIKQFTITGSIPNVLINMIRILEPWLAQKTRIPSVRPIYMPAAYRCCNYKHI